MVSFPFACGVSTCGPNITQTPPDGKGRNLVRLLLGGKTPEQIQNILGVDATLIRGWIGKPSKLPTQGKRPERTPNVQPFSVSPILGIVQRAERIQTEADNLARKEFGYTNDNLPIKDRTYVLKGVRYSFDRGEPVQPPKGVPTYTLMPDGELIPNKKGGRIPLGYTGDDTVNGRGSRGGSASVGVDALGAQYKTRTGKRRSVLADDTFGRSGSDWSVMGTPIKNHTQLIQTVTEHVALIRVAIVRKLRTNPSRQINGGDISAMVQDTIDRLLGVRWGDTGKGTYVEGTGYVRADQTPTDILGERSRKMKRKVNGRVQWTKPYAERFPNGKPLGSLVSAACMATVREYSKHWRSERDRALVGVGQTKAEQKQRSRARSANNALSKQRAMRMNPDTEQVANLIRQLGAREATILRMLANGYTQENVAKALNITQPAVSGLVKRKLAPMIERLCTQPEYVRNA